MGEYDKSLKYFDSAAVLLHTATDPWRTAINVRNKGKALTHAGKPKEGIVETLKAMEMYARLKDNYTWRVSTFSCQNLIACLEILRPQNAKHFSRSSGTAHMVMESL